MVGFDAQLLGLAVKAMMPTIRLVFRDDVVPVAILEFFHGPEALPFAAIALIAVGL